MTRIERLTELGQQLRDVGDELEAIGKILRSDIGLTLLGWIERRDRTEVLPTNADQVLDMLAALLGAIRVRLEGVVDQRARYAKVAELVALLDHGN